MKGDLSLYCCAVRNQLDSLVEGVVGSFLRFQFDPKAASRSRSDWWIRFPGGSGSHRTGSARQFISCRKIFIHFLVKSSARGDQNYETLLKESVSSKLSDQCWLR